MAQLVRGQPNDPTNPQMQLFVTDAAGDVVDANIVGFRILDITTEINKCRFARQQFNQIQVYPDNGAKYIDVVNLYTGGPAGHKIGTGNYYAPFTPDESFRVGEHIIVWEWKLGGNSPFRMKRQSFFVKEE